MTLALQLVLYKHADVIPPLLASLGRQTYRDWRLFVREQSGSAVEAERVRSLLDASGLPYELEVGENLGFGTGHNRLFARHEAPYVACVNPDLEYAEDAIERALRLFDRPEVAAVQGLLWRTDPGLGRREMIDTTGFAFHAIGDVRDRHSGASAAAVPPAGWVLGPTGTAPFFRRSALLAAASTHGIPFDERFFLYREDIELALRLARAGQRTWFAPEVELFHARTVRAAPTLWHRLRDETRRAPVARINGYAAQWGIALMHGSWRMSARAWMRTLFTEMARTAGLLLTPRAFFQAWKHIFRHIRSYLGSRRAYRRWPLPHDFSL